MLRTEVMQMARDAFGADWGRYFKQKGERKTKAIRRKKPEPSIYLLYRVLPDTKWFGEFQHEVKTGMTIRSPQCRMDILQRDGFHLYAYWPREKEILASLEKDVLKRFREAFGPPTRGREYFCAGRVQDAHRIIVEVLGDSGTSYAQSGQF